MKHLPVLDGDALAASGATVAEAMAAIEAGLCSLGRGASQQPHPPVLSPGGKAFFQPLAAALPAENVACVNWLTHHPDNPAAGLSHSGGLLILNDFATGAALCVMDGIWVSHRRTGYIAGLGVKYLAGEFTDVAVIGPGAIAAFALDAIAALAPLRGRVRVCGRRREKTEQFCAEIASRLGVATVAYDDPRATVEGARLVLTSTTHSGPPFLEADWISGGTLVVMIDRLRVVTRGLLARADRIVTNSRESLASWGLDPARAVRTLPELVAAGRNEPVRPGEIVLYDAGGLAVADLAFANLLWSRLRQTAGGTQS